MEGRWSDGYVSDVLGVLLGRPLVEGHRGTRRSRHSWRGTKLRDRSDGKVCTGTTNYSVNKDIFCTMFYLSGKGKLNDKIIYREVRDQNK